MKIATIYHSIDLDGWMSAAIVKHWFAETYTNKNITETTSDKKIQQLYSENKINTIEFIGYNHGQQEPYVYDYDKIIMSDIAFSNSTMSSIAEKFTGDNFVWCDHHISAMKENEKISHVSGLRRTDLSACQLTWKYFFKEKKEPEIVRLLGLYDSFMHKGTPEEKKVLEFQYGARAVMYDVNTTYDHLVANLEIDRCFDEDIEIYQEQYEQSVEFIHNSGKAIYQFLLADALQSYKNGFSIILDETISDSLTLHRKFIVINKERFNPINFGINYHKEGYDGCACYHYDGKQWRFSLYNDNGSVNCSVIAKKFGGGGHKNASGFVVDDIESFIKTYKI